MGFFDKIKDMLGAGAGGGLDLAELGRRLDLDPVELQNLPIQYTQFKIPKRSGGSRTIQAPAPELKKIQRTILRRLLTRLQVHPCAMAYEKERSIVTNALPHLRQHVVVKFDLIDFFPSTKASRVEEYFRKIGWNREAAKLLTKICTWNGGLPQGAPTSPKLSNLVNYRLDALLHSIAIIEGGCYTRYADDITVSFNDAPRGKINRVVKLMMHYVKKDYRIHDNKKMQVLKRNRRQIVTGLVVNQQLNLPRETRRLLRSVEHRLKKSEPVTLTEQQLAGWNGMLTLISKNR